MAALNARFSHPRRYLMAAMGLVIALAQVSQAWPVHT